MLKKENDMDTEQLEKLYKLKEKGAITAEEFEAQKQILLQQNSGANADKSIWEYFVLCVTDNYFCFKGRARRKEYWSFMLFNALIGMLFSLVSGYLVSTGGSAQGIETLSNLVTIALFVPGIAVLFRRLHDVNFSGLWAVVPVAGFFLLGVVSGYQGYIHRYYGVADNINKEMLFGGLALLLFIYWLFILVLLCRKSQMKENKYGPVPEGMK